MTIRWVVSGFVILGGLAGFVLVSNGYGSPRLHLPLYVVAVTIHLVAVVTSRKACNSRNHLLFIVTVAVLLRAVVSLTPESREGDYYRYMWDGAMTAHGISPYRYSPGEVLNGEVDSPEVLAIRQEGLRVLARINHPELRTLYPSVAQSLFALSYILAPFDSTAWRVVLLLLDIGAGLLILSLLRYAQMPLAWSISYLWNPLLVVETYHYRHLDLALAPFLLLFFWGAWRKRPYLAAAGLAAAAAVKIWPVLLLPFLATRFWSHRLLLLKAGLAFVVLTGLLFVPYWVSVSGESTSGTVAYAKTWNANELAFDLIQAIGARVARTANYVIDGRVAARGILLLLLLGTALWLGLIARHGGIEHFALAISAVIFLMVLAGPTVYPWYFLPVFALAPFLKRPALLFWAPLLVLTYLSRSSPNPSWLLAMVHLPAWLFLILHVRDLYRRKVVSNAQQQDC